MKLRHVAIIAIVVIILCVVSQANSLMTFVFRWTNNAEISYPLLKLHIDGSVIVDSAGNEVRLVGFNGHPKHNEESSSDWNLYNEEWGHLDWFRSHGFNLLRAVIYPQQYHLAEGVFNESFFADYIDPILEMCENRCIYVIISIHQWHTSPYFGGLGIPSWVVEEYLNLAGSVSQKQFVLDMFAGGAYNEDPPRGDAGGAYAQNQFLESMEYVVDRYKGREVIAGIQINEPNNMIGDGWESSQDELVPYWLPFQDQVWTPAMRSIDPDVILIYSPLIDYTPDGGAHWNTRQTQTNVIWGRNFYDYESYYQNYGRNLEALTDRTNSTFQKFLVEFEAPIVFTEIGTWILDNKNLIWVEDVFNVVNQLVSSPGQWGMAWWRYSFWEVWSPRNPDGTDRDVVPLIQTML